MMSSQMLGHRPFDDLRQRIKWLILLRWIAIVGLFIAITISLFLFRLDLPIVPLYLGNIVLLISNCLYALYFRKKHSERAIIVIKLQITLDLLLLTYLLFFSGGIANPFFLFFIFHIVIASILLSNRDAYIQATMAVGLFGLLIAAELWGFAPSDSLFSLHLTQTGGIRSQFLLGLCTAFVATIYITVYMTTSIVNALRSREGELEAAVGDLETANSALTLKDREKSRYVLTVTHDIKGSLSSIQSCLRVVLDGLLGAVAEGVKDMVGRAERRSLSLLRYVNELLYLSTLRTETEIRRLAVLPGEIVGRVAKEFQRRVQERGVELAVIDRTASAAIYVDPYSLEELYRQLLDNAVKYTSRNGRIAVNLDIKVNPRTLQFTVKDTGIGIAEDDLSHVYEDFFSADIPENREVLSTGLGLAIAKQIVAMHGGAIEVESTSGEGSTFRCSIPEGKVTSEGGRVG